MSNLLSKDQAPFLIGAFLSIVAWSMNGLIVEISERKLVQYEASSEVDGDRRKFAVRITNLSGSEAINGARFIIRPAPKSTLRKDDDEFGKISFPGLVDLRVQGPGTASPPTFMLPVIPPGAYFDLIAWYEKNASRPKLIADFQKNDVDPNMKLVSSCSVEAFLLRNQVRIYIVLSVCALLLVGVWVIRVFSWG